MKKFLVAGVALMGWGSALAAPVAPNPAELPGGLSGKNVIHDSNSTFNGQTVTNALGNINTAVTDAQATANAAIPLAQKGVASGVAPLDNDGNVTSPINTTTTQSSKGVSSGVFNELKSYAGTEHVSPVMTYGYGGPQNTSGNWDVPWDGTTLGLPWSTVTMEGGHHADDKAFHWLFGQPVSGGLGAVVDLVAMNGMSAGQGTGVTAGGWNGLVNYGELDAVAREEKTGSAPPKFIASSAITDPDGNSHTVTFTSTGATFSPALPAYWARFLQVGMNVMTNEIAVSNAKLWQNNWLQSWLNTDNATGTFTKVPNTWMGTISSWTTNTDGTVSGITIDTGWAGYSQNTYGFGTTSSGLVPGTATLDGSTPGLDTVFSEISAPAIMFGVYTKAFPEYQLCELDPNNGSRGDINSPNGSVGNQVRQCANEWDFWNNNTVDYSGTLQGLSIDFNSKSKLTNDSYGFLISGGSALPLGYIATNMLGNAPAFYAPGKYGLVESMFSYSDLPTTAGSYTELQDWGFATRTGQNYSGKLSVVQVRDTSLPDEADATTNSETQSIRIQYNDAGGTDNGVATTQNPWDPATGAMGGQIVFNPSVNVSGAITPFYHGIGLAAGGSYTSPNYGIIIDNSGNDYVGTSGNLNFLNSSGVNVGGLSYNSTYSLLYDNLPTEFTQAINIDSGSSGLTVYNKTSTGSLNVIGNSSLNGALNMYSSVDFYNGTTKYGSIWSDADGNLRLQNSNVMIGDISHQNTFNGWSTFNSSVFANNGISVPSGYYYQESLTTPTSSSATCTAGQFTDDANYHYVCVATNTWKRVALSSF